MFSCTFAAGPLITILCLAVLVNFRGINSLQSICHIINYQRITANDLNILRKSKGCQRK